MARTRLLALATALVGVALVDWVWLPAAQAPTTREVDRPSHERFVRLQLLGVNDLHGHLEGGQTLPRNRRPVPVGGVAWLAAHLDRAEHAHPGPTIRVHAGDMVGASPLVSSHFHDEPTVRAMNLMDFDAGTLGNHEFDEGVPEAMRLLRGARPGSGSPSDRLRFAFAGADFPYLAANTRSPDGQLLLPPYAVIERAGVKVGVLGVTTPSTPDFLLARHASKVRFLDISTTVNRYARELQRRGVETIVVLAHAGGFERAGRSVVGEIFDETREMGDAVDVVIAGHSHSVLDARIPNRTGKGDKLVVEAGEYGTAYDRAFLTIDRATGDVVKKRASVRRTWNADVAPRSDVTALVADYAGRAARLGGQVLGHLHRGLRRRATPDADGLDRLMADSQRSLARADVAFVDPVSIRTGLKPGPVTYSGLFEVAPYEHPVLRMKIRGAALVRVVASQQRERSGSKLISSGVRAQGTALTLEAGGYVEPRRIYTVAASELLATGRRSPLLSETTWERRPVGTELDALLTRFRGSIRASEREGRR